METIFLASDDIFEGPDLEPRVRIKENTYRISELDDNIKFGLESFIADEMSELETRIEFLQSCLDAITYSTEVEDGSE